MTTSGAGQTVGDFRLVASIGRGGMGEVFRAQNVRVERMQRAVKVIRPDLAVDEAFRSRFLREAEFMEQLQHPNILRVENVGEDRGVLFLVMELLSGETCSALLERCDRQLAVEVATTLVHQALAGISHAHRNGVIHRDLKPANLFLTTSGTVKVLDFGIARDANSAAQLTRTMDGIPGSPAYYAPEFVEGARASAASDIYSLGISLFELLTGTLPFKGGGGTDAQAALALMVQHATVPLPDPRTLRPELPEALAAAVFRACAKNPAERFETADAFAAALVRFTRPSALAGLAHPSAGQEPRQATPAVVPPRTDPSARTPQPLSTSFALPSVGQGRAAPSAGLVPGGPLPTVQTQFHVPSATGPVFATQPVFTAEATGSGVGRFLKWSAALLVLAALGAGGVFYGVRVRRDSQGAPSSKATVSADAHQALTGIEAEKARGRAFLVSAIGEEGTQKTRSGLVYRDLTKGTGRSPKATDRVKVAYRATTIDGKEFDSSARSGAVSFTLQEVLACWTEGLQKMKVGGKAKLICPSDLAYGDKGRPGMVPGGATVVFEVELLAIPRK